MTDENYIYDTIRSTCIQHEAGNLINDFHYGIDRINSVEKRLTLRFCNELPDYYDIRWDSSFQEEWAFHYWLAKHIKNYIGDAKANRQKIENFLTGSLLEIRPKGTPFDAEDSIDAIQFAIMNKKGKSTMAMETTIKTERYMTESEARYTAELQKIELKLQQDISDAQFEAQKARCELEKWFTEEKVKEQETDKALKRKAYYDGLLASGFTKDEAFKIVLNGR